MAQFGAPNFLKVIDAYEAGSDRARRSRLEDMAEQGRALQGKALQGDKNALAQLGQIDPQAAMQTTQFTQEQKKQQLGEFLSAAYNAKDPQSWAQVVQRFKAQGHQFDPGEEDFGNRENLIRQGMSVADQMGYDWRAQESQRAQANSDRAYGLDVQQLNIARANAGKPRTAITDIGGKRVLIDENTGDVLKELGESPTKQQSVPTGYQAKPGGKPGEVERLPGYKDVDLEGKLRTEFQGQTKDFRDVRDSYNRIRASAQNPTPAGDIALIYNYMKMLDPSSVVRESEFATAANAAPFLTRVGIDPEKVKAIWEGKKLVPEVRADFLNRAQSLYGQQEQTFKTLADQYRTVATKNQLDPDTIILTPTAPPDTQQGNVGALKQKYGLE